MADLQEILTQITEQVKKATSTGGFDELMSKLPEYKEKLTSFMADIASKGAAAAKESGLLYSSLMALSEVKGAGAAFHELTNIVVGSSAESVNSLKNLKDSVGDIGVVLAQLSPTVTATMAPLSKQFNEVTYSARGLQDAMKTVGDAADKVANMLPSGLGAAVKKVTEGMAGLAQMAGNAITLEKSFLQLSAASGNFGNVIGKSGEDLENMDSLLAGYIDRIGNTALATGRSISEVKQLSETLERLPAFAGGTTVAFQGLTDANGALANSENNVSNAMETNTALLKEISGLGLDSKTAIEAVATMNDELGTSAQKAMTNLASMSIVADDLGIPLSHVQDFTKNAASNFKFLGDNVEGSSKILYRFGSALKDSGMGPKAIQELTAGVIKGINDMSIAQKAFISGQSGGKGGLKGAFDIDIMLNEGKIDEVSKKMETAFRKNIGGKLVTLADVKRGGEAEATQMTKQIQLLTTGPFKMAEGAQQAQRIIEAMSKGEFVAQPLMDSTEKTVNAINDGSKIIEKQTRILQTIETRMAMLAAKAGQESYKTIRESKGDGLAAANKSLMLGAQGKASEMTGFAEGKAGTEGVFEIKNSLLESAQAFKEAAVTVKIKDLTQEIEDKEKLTPLAGKNIKAHEENLARKRAELKELQNQTMATEVLPAPVTAAREGAVAGKKTKEAQVAIEAEGTRAARTGQKANTEVLVMVECPSCGERHIQDAIERKDKANRDTLAGTGVVK